MTWDMITSLFLRLTSLLTLILMVAIGAITQPFLHHADLHLAYQVTHDDQMDIYLMDVALRQSFNITQTVDVDEITPSWSPDGNTIAFARRTYERWDVYTIHASGRDLQAITTGEGSSYMPSWSPDGKYIAFASDRDGDWDIYIYDVSTQAISQVTDNTVSDTSPDWSADGERLVFTSWIDGNHELVSTNMIGGDLQQLTSDTAREATPRTSPDGEQILWVSERAPNNSCAQQRDTSQRNNRACVLHVDIYQMNTDGTQAERLTTQTGLYWSPDLSPDGDYIAFGSGSYGFRWHIYLMDTDEQDIIRLTNDSERETAPRWRPSS